MKAEQWQDVPGYEGCYQVSSLGRVYSFKSRKLRKTFSAAGYRQVALFREGSQRSVGVHRLVLEAFMGPCPEGHQCNHKDGNKANNCLANLEWMTPSGNTWHSIEVLGRGRTGSGNSNAKLTESDVAEMRRLYAAGKWNQYELADIYNVSQGHVSAVLRRAAWRHL